MTGTRVVIAVVGALVLGVTACSGSDPEPRVAPPSSTSTSPTTSPSPSAPTMPAAARGTDAASAEAFVRFYWEMVNYAQATGDVSGLEVLATRCINCNDGVNFIEDTYSADGEIRGGRAALSLFKTGFAKRDGDWWAIVECTVSLSPQEVDFPGKGRDKHYGGGDTQVRLYLQPRSDTWTIRSLAEQ